MKSKYHITVKGKDEAVRFEDTISLLGADRGTRVYTSDTADLSTYDYILPLSKYELLYVRLTCTFESLKNIDEYELSD